MAHSPEHLKHLPTKYRDNPPPWPFIKQSHAARILGVTGDYIDGLANNPIPAWKIPTPKGNTIWVFQKSAIEEIANKAGLINGPLDTRQRRKGDPALKGNHGTDPPIKKVASTGRAADLGNSSVKQPLGETSEKPPNGPKKQLPRPPQEDQPRSVTR